MLSVHSVFVVLGWVQLWPFYVDVASSLQTCVDLCSIWSWYVCVCPVLNRCPASHLWLLGWTPAKCKVSRRSNPCLFFILNIWNMSKSTKMKVDRHAWQINMPSRGQYCLLCLERGAFERAGQLSSSSCRTIRAVRLLTWWMSLFTQFILLLKIHTKWIKLNWTWHTGWLIEAQKKIHFQWLPGCSAPHHSLKPSATSGSNIAETSPWAWVYWLSAFNLTDLI